MTEGNNPEEKPSFFDFSEEEARSWPPANSYETEDETDVPETTAGLPMVEEFDLEDLYAEEFNILKPAPKEKLAAREKPALEEIPDPKEKPTLPKEEANPLKDSKPVDSGSKYVDMLFAASTPDGVEDEDKEALDAILGTFVDKPVTPDSTDTSEKKSDDFDIDSMLSAPSAPVKEGLMSEEKTPDTREAIEDYDFASVIEEEDSLALPFRTYSAYDYKEETLTESSLDEAEEKQGLKLNRNILIVLAVLLLVGGWYGFQSLFNRKVPGVTNARKRKPPKKEQRSLLAISRELIPVWEITSQKSISDNEERKIVSDIYSESGRDNPFMMPDSVLADLKRVADAQVLKTQAPKTYRRKAYRATLVGVLTSKDSTIALINYQEAVFDVIEGTSRPKILKLATKAMDKAKANTQEMVIGSYIGPWQITKMDSPKDAFTEAKVHLQNQGQVKTLSMGRAEELGIFDDTGDIDNLDSPSEGDDFDGGDAAEDDSEF